MVKYPVHIVFYLRNDVHVEKAGLASKSQNTQLFSPTNPTPKNGQHPVAKTPACCPYTL
jgi:hypothetical protein